MKRLSVFFAFLFVLVIISCTSCEKKLPEHFHIEADLYAVDPSCVETGLGWGVYCLSCDETLVEQEIIPALGHTEVIDKAVPPTSFTEGLTEGAHCEICGEVLIEPQPIPTVLPRPMTFPYGSVTMEFTVIDTDNLRLNVPENIFISEKLVENLNLITAIMEEVSGLTFEGNPKYVSGLTVVDVVKLTDTESELGPASAGPGGATVSAGDLVDLFALVHECSHMLQYNQSPWFYCTWMMESISTYTTYKVQAYIEENYPELVPLVGTVYISFDNYGIQNFEELYKHPLEYWMENTFEYSVNQNYSIGFAFAWYLDEVYGDYTKWITEYEKENPYPKGPLYLSLPTEEQIKAFKMTYGEEVFDGFYPWLKENETIFDYRLTDLRGAEKIQVYPMFAGFGILYDVPNILYRDLIIDFSAGKRYLTEYKGRNIEGMMLECRAGITVELYDFEGRLMRVEEANWDPIPFDGVSYIRLIGEGESWFTITGFDCEYAEQLDG